MSHQDRNSDIVINHRTIKQVVDWLLVPSLFSGMQVRAGAKWKPRMLAVAALLWACSDLSTLQERFSEAQKIVGRVFRWHLPPGKTYQGFMKMLRKWHVDLMLAITPHIRVQMREVLPDQWETAGYVVFACDGSRIALSRTKSLEQGFSPKKKKKRGGKVRRCDTKKAVKKNAQRKAKQQQRAASKQSEEAIEKKTNSPQMWLTLMWHVGSGLPWDWLTGPSDSSERGHLEEMLSKLPENSLITADAGFVGYDFWAAILDAGHHFVARVGANVSLTRGLGYARQHDHTVYLWPDSVAKKNQPPLVLRLIVIHNGKHPVYLVTDLNKSQLSDKQAATIYAHRWGIELFFRTFKQTFNRSKLRSRSADNASLELDWSLLGLWCVCLLGHDKDPSRLSPATAIRAFQSTLRHWRCRPDSKEENLWSQLRIALLDDYDRTTDKTSRNYPRKKKRKRIGTPKITTATKRQIIAAKELTEKQIDFRLSA